MRLPTLVSCMAFIVGLLAGCERQQENQSPNSPGPTISKDLVWSFFVSDTEPGARIRKWSKPELWGLIIVDPTRDAFYQQFAPLLRQAGEGSGVKIHVCEAIVESSELVRPYEANCGKPNYDFYLVATNGGWSGEEWQRAGTALQGQAGEMLAEVREQLATLPGKTCRAGVRSNPQVANQIELAVSVIDSSESLVFGKCGVLVSLYMLGVQPFDGARPLELEKEAENLALFLTKRTPYGGTYLLQLLYAPSVKPGMQKDEFLGTLP